MSDPRLGSPPPGSRGLNKSGGALLCARGTGTVGCEKPLS
jgi:hypothetical protein